MLLSDAAVYEEYRFSLSAESVISTYSLSGSGASQVPASVL